MVTAERDTTPLESLVCLVVTPIMLIQVLYAYVENGTTITYAKDSYTDASVD